MKTQETYDIAIIGAGPGGYFAAIKAAQMGARALLIEKEKLGGTCINWGCIPTKAFLADVKSLYRIKRSEVYDGKEHLYPNFEKMVLRKNWVVESITKGIEAVLRSKGIQLVYGSGCLVDPKTIGVTITSNGRKEVYGANNIIIAAGSQAANLPTINPDKKNVLTSREILNIQRVPKDMVIIGGGAIGVEFATIFNVLGTKVTILEMLPSIIPAGDEEVSFLLQVFLQKQGITVLSDTKVTAISDKMGRVEVTGYEKSGKTAQFTAEKVLMAVGRIPCTEGLGIDGMGFQMDGRFIKVNTRMETNVDGIYAIGDVIGKIMLAHAAYAEAAVAIENILGKSKDLDYREIPICVYGFPELASIGLSEREAREKGMDIHVGKFPYQCNGRAVAMGETDGFVKIIADKKSGVLLGVHILGEDATNLIGECILGMHLGATVKNLAEVVKGHPTLSETITEAALDWSDISIHSP